MESPISQTIVAVLIVVFAVVLVVQVFILIKVRRSLMQMGQFIRFINLFFREFSSVHSQSASIAVNNQTMIKRLRKNIVRSNQKDSCSTCRFRLSFLKIDSGDMEFTYRCKFTNDAVTLDYHCAKFELDPESSPAASV